MSNLEETNVRQVYQKIANHFNHSRGESKWDWIESFLDQYQEPNTVCDIGCGSGRNMRSNCFGIDNCANFIKICQEKGLKVKLSEMINIELPDESYNAIICIAVFHHLDSEDKRIKALLEMKRILKAGGRILLSVWSKNQPENTKRIFEYGDNLVPWNNHGKIYQRYYYIFEIDEIKNLFIKVGLTLLNHTWEYGNEVFILE
jgi:ubiquinone/menaquinone biosynthesis C-methylase UbiE